MSKFFIIQRIFNRKEFFIKDIYRIKIVTEEFKRSFHWPFPMEIDAVLTDVLPGELKFAYVDKSKYVGGTVRHFIITVNDIEDGNVKITHIKTGEEITI